MKVELKKPTLFGMNSNKKRYLEIIFQDIILKLSHNKQLYRSQSPHKSRRVSTTSSGN